MLSIREKNNQRRTKSYGRKTHIWEKKKQNTNVFSPNEEKKYKTPTENNSKNSIFFNFKYFPF